MSKLSKEDYDMSWKMAKRHWDELVILRKKKNKSDEDKNRISELEAMAE